jgi:hypothetical protein
MSREYTASVNNSIKLSTKGQTIFNKRFGRPMFNRNHIKTDCGNLQISFQKTPFYSKVSENIPIVGTYHIRRVKQ